ncbi:MAG: J domain-containing protein [Deltaproteobacteria bacterium]|nr:J domain-containing protein [Deltaproteobacteria bacterium]
MNYKRKYEEITKARHILELPESATLEQIKNHYKRLIKKWHPDVCQEKREICEKKTIEINDAYKCIMNYCSHYKFSFSEEEVEKHLSPEEWWFKRFGGDPIWNTGSSATKKR